MIYFDTNKNAYNYEVPNYIATIDDTIWLEYAGTDKWDIIDGVFTDITDTQEYKDEQTAKRQAEFEKEFFETSLGWIRRAVNMANGTTKDFLSDLLPTISMAVQSGTPVNIIAYDEPDFTEEITDWKPYQHLEVVTPQFIQECFQQLSNDFLPINEEEENNTSEDEQEEGLN